MERYESIYYRGGAEISNVLRTVANHYIGMNPPEPFTFCAFSREGPGWDRNGCLCMDLREKLPDAKQGENAYAAFRIWSDSEEEKLFEMACFGPARLYVAGEMVFQSSVTEEVNVKHKKAFPVQLKRGWNDFIFCFSSTASGFGAMIAPEEVRWHWLPFLAPFTEREGCLGAVYSQAFPGDFRKMKPDFCLGGSERETGLEWYPQRWSGEAADWNREAAGGHRWETVFGEIEPGQRIYGKTSLRGDGREIMIQTGAGGTGACDRVRVWLDQTEILDSCQEQKTACAAAEGCHTVTVMVERTGLSEKGNYPSVEIYTEGGPACCEMPERICGATGDWLYLGPFENSVPVFRPEELTLNRLYDTGNGGTYWRLDGKDNWVRPCLQNELFGRWNYPLGVTLYGLLQTGRHLEENGITQYAASHIAQCVQMQEYAMWDEAVYGYPQINNQLCTMSMLDDCGSFASAMLEAYSEIHEEAAKTAVKTIAKRVADHMEHVQERQEDGAFYRICKDFFMENTMWADDLYMSTPFLIRYYQMTGDAVYLDDAAKQFMLFKKYLFMEREQVMSHVYDFKYQTPTKMPWGRGNGWVLFSLSEVLAVLPEDHPKREELLTFFRQLSEGILKLQGGNGLWHQLLTHEDSYEETSCTAMFIYGFSRGIRYGWLPDEDRRYRKAVQKAWEGLTKYAIDRKGNVYGVCRGSQYSFTPDYYKYDLTSRDNDTHGIGIVLRAGIEAGKLE